MMVGLQIQSRLCSFIGAAVLAAMVVAGAVMPVQARADVVADSLWQTIIAARPQGLGLDQLAPACPAAALSDEAFESAVHSECLGRFNDAFADSPSPLAGCDGATDSLNAFLTSGYRCKALANEKRQAAFALRKLLQDAEKMDEGERQGHLADEAELIKGADGMVAAWNGLAVCVARQAAQIANPSRARASQWHKLLASQLDVGNQPNLAWKKIDHTAAISISLFQQGVKIFGPDNDPAAIAGGEGAADWSGLYPISLRQVSSQTGASFTQADLKRIANLAKQGKAIMDASLNCRFDDAQQAYDDFDESAQASIAEVEAQIHQAEQEFYCAAQRFGVGGQAINAGTKAQNAFIEGEYLIEGGPEGFAAVPSHAAWKRSLRVHKHMVLIAEGVKSDISEKTIAAQKDKTAEQLKPIDVLIETAAQNNHLCSDAAEKARLAAVVQARDLVGKISCQRDESVRLRAAKLETLSQEGGRSACAPISGGGNFVHLHAKGAGVIFTADGTGRLWEGHETVVARAARNDTAASFLEWAEQKISVSAVCGPTGRPMPHAPDVWTQAPELSIIGGPFSDMERAAAALPKAEWRDTGPADSAILQDIAACQRRDDNQR